MEDLGDFVREVETKKHKSNPFQKKYVDLTTSLFIFDKDKNVEDNSDIKLLASNIRVRSDLIDAQIDFLTKSANDISKHFLEVDFLEKPNIKDPKLKKQKCKENQDKDESETTGDMNDPYYQAKVKVVQCLMINEIPCELLQTKLLWIKDNFVHESSKQKLIYLVDLFKNKDDFSMTSKNKALGNSDIFSRPSKCSFVNSMRDDVNVIFLSHKTETNTVGPICDMIKYLRYIRPFSFATKESSAPISSSNPVQKYSNNCIENNYETIQDEIYQDPDEFIDDDPVDNYRHSIDTDGRETCMLEFEESTKVKRLDTADTVQQKFKKAKKTINENKIKLEKCDQTSDVSNRMLKVNRKIKAKESTKNHGVGPASNQAMISGQYEWKLPCLDQLQASTIQFDKKLLTLAQRTGSRKSSSKSSFVDHSDSLVLPLPRHPLARPAAIPSDIWIDTTTEGLNSVRRSSLDLDMMLLGVNTTLSEMLASVFPLDELEGVSLSMLDIWPIGRDRKDKQAFNSIYGDVCSVMAEHGYCNDQDTASAPDNPFLMISDSSDDEGLNNQWATDPADGLQDTDTEEKQETQVTENTPIPYFNDQLKPASSTLFVYGNNSIENQNYIIQQQSKPPLPMVTIQRMVRQAMATPPAASIIRFDSIVSKEIAAESYKAYKQSEAKWFYAKRVFVSLIFLCDAYNRHSVVTAGEKKDEAETEETLQMRLAYTKDTDTALVEFIYCRP